MRYINKAARPFTRRTTSAGGKVPPPSAHANAPPGGVRRLARAKHGRSVSPLIQYINKAASPLTRRTQARAARCRCRVRTPMPLRGACGQPVQARHRSVCITICAGGKVPLPGAHANAPPGGVRHLAQASIDWSAKLLSKSTEVPRRAGRSGRAIVHAVGGQALKRPSGAIRK